MSFPGQTRLVTLENPFTESRKQRGFFTCLEVRLPINGILVRQALARAEEIFPGLNRGQANTSLRREEEQVYQDNLAGLVAELACRAVLEERYGSVLLPPDPSLSGARNQIDLRLACGKTMEARSSGIKNGLEFALFKTNAQGKPYIDVIGPYTNGYKPVEEWKDYYLRPLYTFDLNRFSDYLRKREEVVLYLVGGADRTMMEDPGQYVVKKMELKGGGGSLQSGQYRAIPLLRALDICQFFRRLEADTGLSVCQSIQNRSPYFRITI